MSLIKKSKNIENSIKGYYVVCGCNCNDPVSGCNSEKGWVTSYVSDNVEYDDYVAANY